jgi:hypothetical protein
MLSGVPNGTYILTSHEDGCLAFWDAKNETTPIHVRTIDSTNVNIPRGSYKSPSETFTFENRSLKWLGVVPPILDDTSLVIAGGQLSNLPQKGSDIFRLWAKSVKFSGGIHCRGTLPTSKNSVSSQLSPILFHVPSYRAPLPFITERMEPLVLLALLETGDIAAFSMPDCQPLAVAQTLPPAISFISLP